jgi:Fe-S-cluster-containing dehydrogenase component
VLDLYDPDRARESSDVKTGKPISQAQVKDLLKGISEKYAKNEGDGLAILAEASSSMSQARLLKEIKAKFPKVQLTEYEPADLANSEKSSEKTFGRRLRTKYHLEKAKRILSLDSDFLHLGAGSIGNARGFANARRVHSSSEAKNMNRLYQVESGFSVTGGMADHRLRLPTGQIPAFAAAVCAELLKQTRSDDDLLKQFESSTSKFQFSEKDKWISVCVKDLVQHTGSSVVIAAEHLPEEVHQIVVFMNAMLDAPGNTLNYVSIPEKATTENLPALADSISKGSVKTLVILGGNPAYNAPADLKWESLQEKVPEVIRYGHHLDETSKKSTHHIAATHYLESWDDGRTFDGTIVPVQPMILPIFEGIQILELLAHLGGLKTTDAYEIVYDTVSSRILDANKQKVFNKFLNRGFLPNSGYVSYSKTAYKKDVIKDAAIAIGSGPSGYSKDNLELVIQPSTQVYDGRYANNGWLQELPEPMNKICWDNSINISPRLAKELNIEITTPRHPLANGENPLVPRVSAAHLNTHLEGKQVAPIAELTINGVSIKGPVNIQPGLANYTVIVSMGYGRRFEGQVADGAGFDIFPLLDSRSPSYRSGATLKLTGETKELGNVQEHWSMEGRDIIREASVEFYEKNPDFVNKMGTESHAPANYGSDKDKPLAWKVTNQPRGGSAYETPKFTAPQQWGMSIDLNVCTGCNQCSIACQAENNIPIVGREQVKHGREMSWIRMDRYYSAGDVEKNKFELPEDPEVLMMPMACQQCEMAPCEQVCPVNATVHDEQGLNTMAYNRCVGTRYCSNNCPYKVRRFNFFDWNKRQEGKKEDGIFGRSEYYKGPFGTNVYETDKGKLKAMQANPDVSVRMRGVMEKCTYCQQRIEGAKINQLAKAGASGDVKVPDGVIKPACQQACPTQAIIFGDIADTQTDVYKIKQSDRDYSVLGYLNTRPRTTYLARLRNPNLDMPGVTGKPFSQMEYDMSSGHGSHHDAGHDDHETGAHH